MTDNDWIQSEYKKIKIMLKDQINICTASYDFLFPKAIPAFHSTTCTSSELKTECYPMDWVWIGNCHPFTVRYVWSTTEFSRLYVDSLD